VLRDDVPVTFRVRAAAGVAEPEVLLEETVADKDRWVQRSVGLAAWAGREVAISLETEAEELGTVALWASPTVSGTRSTEQPNVIFYIIDAGGADYMSAYGYNRRTTPNLERLAAEGAIFEYAYSNSSWSKTSTPSFATSLHHSVLGGYKTDTDPIPDQAVTMADRLHAAGYQTAVITSNPYAGTMSSLDRGADLLRDDGVDRNSISTVELHEDFWNWREAFPGEPYFVHFQTTDLHWPWRPVAPFAGMFIEPERRERYYEWERRVSEAAGLSRPRWPNIRSPQEVYEKAGVDRIALFDAVRALYDECLAHQDWQLGRLVERLKADGEWEHTLLIVAADHGNNHGLGVFDSLPEGPGLTLRSYVTRVPMVIVWPESIPAGQRFTQPVSMIDMLPTIVDLAGLPLPDVMQGRSLAPLLLGETSEAEWEPRPVVFDEFYVDWDSGELEGTLEVIDGRWGAALRVTAEEEPEKEESEGAAEEPAQQVTEEEKAESEAGEAVQADTAADEEAEAGGEEEEEVAAEEDEGPRLRLYDLWNDPYTLRSVHEEHPELVEKYTAMLEGLWEAHQALAQQFSRTGEVPLTQDQIETLRTLGYIR
jgi:arylsulfatase A-like enzyme